MSAIEAAAEEKFVRRITAHLLEEYPTAAVKLPDMETTVAGLPEETLQSLVRSSVERARSYSLDQESSIAAFSTLMFEVAPNFDKHNLSQVLLNDESVEPNVRLDELLEVLTEKNWETVRKTYDPEAWFEQPEESEPEEETPDKEK